MQRVEVVLFPEHSLFLYFLCLTCRRHRICVGVESIIIVG